MVFRFHLTCNLSLTHTHVLWFTLCLGFLNVFYFTLFTSIFFILHVDLFCVSQYSVLHQRHGALRLATGRWMGKMTGWMLVFANSGHSGNGMSAVPFPGTFSESRDGCIAAVLSWGGEQSIRVFSDLWIPSSMNLLLWFMPDGPLFFDLSPWGTKHIYFTFVGKRTKTAL